MNETGNQDHISAETVPTLFGSRRPKIWLRRAPKELHHAIREYAMNRRYGAAATSLANLLRAIICLLTGLCLAWIFMPRQGSAVESPFYASEPFIRRNNDVVAIGGPPGYERQIIFLTPVSIAAGISGAVPNIKYVNVFNQPNYIERLFLTRHAAPCRILDVESLTNKKDIPGRQKCLRGRMFDCFIIARSRWERLALADNDWSQANSQHLGWSVPGIFNFNIKFPISWIQIVHVGHPYISALGNTEMLGATFGCCSSNECSNTQYAGGEDHPRGGEYYGPRRYSEPPFVRRFYEALAVIPLSMGFIFLSGYQFYRGRYGAGIALLIGGWLIFCGGIVIISLTMWPTTWEWWI